MKMIYNVNVRKNKNPKHFSRHQHIDTRSECSNLTCKWVTKTVDRFESYPRGSSENNCFHFISCRKAFSISNIIKSIRLQKLNEKDRKNLSFLL